MRQGDVEQWVIGVVDRVERGLRVEDDRVECKRQLVDPARAARRIAGHANQAREDRILWIIGVDEEATPPVLGVEPGGPDPAEWWAQIESKFEDVAPSLTLVNVPVGNHNAVLGLGFDTSRPPYVLKVPSGEINRDVPWREGTRTRSANRVDLLKLLVPLRDRPHVSVLDGWLELVKDPSGFSASWHGLINLYLDCTSPVVFPDHRCAGRVLFDSGHEDKPTVTPGAATATALAPSGFLTELPLSSSALLAEQGHNQVVVRDSSPIWLTVRGPSTRAPSGWRWDLPTAESPSACRLNVELGTAGIDPITVKLSATLKPVYDRDRGPDRLAKWTL